MISRNPSTMKHRGLALAVMAVLGLTLALGLFAGSSSSALAAPGGTPGAPGGQGQGSDKALENFLQREQKLVGNFNHRYEVSDRVAAKIQALIDKGQAAGKDTAGLEAGLAAFNARVAAAKAYTDQASALLAAPAGFDADGNVTDRQQARATVTAIRAALRNANKELVKAVPDLRHAINDYRKANKPEGGDDDQGEDDGQGQGQGQGQGGLPATETATP